MHPSHYANDLILVDQKLDASLSLKVLLLVHYIEATPTDQVCDKTREPMFIGNHVSYNNLIQIVEKQLLDNDKQQECVNMEILTKVFCYMCKTSFEG